MFEAPDIPGAEDVIAWFGYWPTFHDAEVISIAFDRVTGCRVVVHAFGTTGEIDARGYYVHDKHALVTFTLEPFPTDFPEAENSRIEGFNHQNVLANLAVNKIPEGYELVLYACHGVDGVIQAPQMTVKLTPGIPPISVYAEQA